MLGIRVPSHPEEETGAVIVYAALPTALSRLFAADVIAFTVCVVLTEIVEPLAIEEDECVGVVPSCV